MVKWLVLLALVPALAHANEIATDIAPPEIAEPPRDHSLGIRFGPMLTEVEDHERTMIAFGAQWNLALTRRLRAMVTYDYLLATGDVPPEMPVVHGRGHTTRIGGWLAVLDRTIRDDGMVYLGIEATGGAAYVSDNYLGPQVLPHALVGTRVGYELWADGDSPSSMFGAHLLFATLITPGDVGFVFQIGMEWGQRTKR